MSTDTTFDLNRFEELLPAFVNGSASSFERNFVKDVLAHNAQARAALAWHEALAEKVAADIDATAADIGWDRLQQRVRMADTKAAKMPYSVLSNTSLQAKLRSLTQMIDSWMPHRWLSGPAMSGVCAVLVATVGLQLWVGSSGQEREYSQVRGISESQPTDTGFKSTFRYVKLNFKDRVAERDMRLLLIRTGAVLVGGPGQLGDYTVAIPAHQIESALKEIQASLLTESIKEIVPPQSAPHSSNANSDVSKIEQK
jgi:hypothetical protein